MSTRGLITRENHVSRVSLVFRVPKHAPLPRAVLCRHRNAWGLLNHVYIYNRESERREEGGGGEERERIRASEEEVSQSDVELGRVSRERNPHRSIQLTNCPAALPLTPPALLPPDHSLPYSQPFRRKPGEFRRILSRALLRVFRFDRALPSSKNTMTAS